MNTATLNKYKVVVAIEGNWRTRYEETIVYAEDEEEAKYKAEKFLDSIDTKYSENSLGGYEEASIEDIILIA